MNQSHEEKEKEMKPNGTGMGAEEDVESGASWRKCWGIWNVDRPGIDFHDYNELVVNGPRCKHAFKELLFRPSVHHLRWEKVPPLSLLVLLFITAFFVRPVRQLSSSMSTLAARMVSVVNNLSRRPS
jgi:hypothetical protein